MSELDFWWTHTVAVETFLGSSAYGDRWAAAEPVLCFVDDDTRLVRDSSGTEVVSNSTVFADIGMASAFALGSIVTTSSGREARVLGIDRSDSGGVADLAGLDHIEVSLT